MSRLGSVVFRPLSLGSIRPAGWFERQLRVQADGITGRLDEFWPDVRDSGWFGGDAEAWERAPYWLDGLIPLAFVLDDERLKAKARRRVEMILDRQSASGWLGPGEGDEKFDMWAHFLADKMLLQYHDATGDERAFQAVEKNLRMLHEYLPKTPLRNWGKYRWFEGLIAVYAVYERTGEAWLLELAQTLHDQGFDWQTFYEGEDVTVPTPRRGMWKWAKHVVNTALALKGYPLWSRLSGDEADRGFAARMLDVLDRYHGQVTGIFTGDECLAGKLPTQGTELCAVADAMYSLELLLSVLGEAAFGDRLERLAYNAWPATNSPDMWSHQYDQQVNQVQCTINPDFLWSTNHADSNIFGLEPNYGCCTANLHQAWPKLAAHLWMRTQDDGIAAVAYAPSEVRFESSGVRVTVALDTDYPFRETLRFTVTPERAVAFPFLLRIPAWAEGAELRIDGEMADTPQPGAFHRIEREWAGETVIELRLPMTVRAAVRYNDAVAVERGPLVYSLRMGEDWRRVNEDKPHREPPHADWEIHPATPWNYALEVDVEHPESSVTFEERPVGEYPFSPEGAPIVATVQGRRLTRWELRHGWAAETPISPVTSDEPLEALALIPYGCTNLRVTEFPRLSTCQAR